MKLNSRQVDNNIAVYLMIVFIVLRLHGSVDWEWYVLLTPIWIRLIDELAYQSFMFIKTRNAS